MSNVTTVGTLIYKITGDRSALEKELDLSSKAVQKLGKEMVDAGKKLSIGLTAPLALIGGLALKNAADFEKQQIAFETLLGSADRAGVLLKQIQDFAAATPFEMPGLVEGAKRLLAVGVAAGDIVPTLRNLGNAAGGNAETLDRLTNAYSKLAAKGRASLEELNMFTEAGVPILKALADHYGTTTDQMFAMVNAGTVGFKDVNAALVDLTTGSGQYAGMIEKQSQSLSGLLSTLRDDYNMLMRDLIGVVAPALKDVIRTVDGWLKGWSDLGDGTKKLIVLMGGIAAAIGPLLIGIGKVTLAVRALNMSAMWGPLGIIAAVAAAGIGIGILVTHLKNQEEAERKAMNATVDYTAQSRTETYEILRRNIARAEQNRLLVQETIAQLEASKAQLEANKSRFAPAQFQGMLATLNASIKEQQGKVEGWSQSLDNAKTSLRDFDKQQTETAAAIGTASKSWQSYRDAEEATIATEFARIEQEAALARELGNTYDASAEKQKVLQKAIEDLLAIPADQISEPFRLTDITIQGLIDRVLQLKASTSASYDAQVGAARDATKDLKLLGSERYGNERMTELQLYQYHKALQDRQTANDQAAYDARKAYINGWTSYAMQQWGTLFEALGEGLAGGEGAWQSFAKAAVGSIASILQALGQQFAVEAAGALAETLMGQIWKGPSIAALVAASAAAYTASGIVGALANQIVSAASGADFITRGPQLLVVGDNPSGKEHVVVSDASREGASLPKSIIVRIGTREFNAMIEDEIDNRRILLNRRSIKG